MIEINKPREKDYMADKIYKEAGHKVLRLPPYMCDLNPIEMIWAQIKTYVRQKNPSGDLSLTNLKRLTIEAIESVHKNDWKVRCEHIKALERKMYENDRLVENVVDSIIIELGELDSDSEPDLGDSSSNEGEDDDEDGDEDEVIATPLVY